MTTAADRIAARLEDLPAGSLRRRVLESAGRFKSSWVELGRLLCEVQGAEAWKDWGYPSFEAYCSRELFIKRQTAEKLTLSYRFIDRHEPEMTRPRDPRPAPAFEVIEVLSRAEAAGRLPEEGYREIRDDILDRPPTPAALSRRIAEKYGSGPRPPPPPQAERLGRLAGMAQRLAEACADERAVPRAVAGRAGALARELSELLDHT